MFRLSPWEQSENIRRTTLLRTMSILTFEDWSYDAESGLDEASHVPEHE